MRWLFLFAISLSFYSSNSLASDTVWRVTESYNPECVATGDSFTSSYAGSISCRFRSSPFYFTIKGCKASSRGLFCRYTRSDNRTGEIQIANLSNSDTCPVGKIPNESTGLCEEPDFCSSSEFLQMSASESNACAAQYPDYFTDFSSSCTSRSDYSFTCNQGSKKPEQPDPDKPDPDKPDPDKPDPDKPDPDKPDPDKPDPDKPDPDKPDPDKPDPDKPDPDKPDPDYNNSGNATGSGSSGGSASASDGNVSVDIDFDGLHNRLDAVNENLAGTNERIETTNQLFNDFSNRYNKNSRENINAINDLGSGLGKKIDDNGKLISDSVNGLGEQLSDLADGTNTTINNNGDCSVGAFRCDGNAYECFIARQSWKNNCLIESLTGDPLTPHEGVPIQTGQEVADSGDALIDDLKGYSSSHLDPDKLSNGDVLITDSLDKFNESNGLSFDEKCPAPNVVDTGMGKFTIDYTPFCDLALYVRAMLMLFASIGSILMISKFS